MSEGYYGDPCYMFRPKVNADNREREQNNGMRERSNLMERDEVIKYILISSTVWSKKIE